MILALLLGVAPAWAAATPPTTEATVLAGGRTAPESAIRIPSGFEGGFEPSALLAVDVRVRFGAERGPWARLAAGSWAYAPDVDASEIHGGGAAGWTGTRAELAGRYDVAWFPLLTEASNGRAEVMGRVRLGDDPWALTPSVTLVDRRYINGGAADYSTGEAGAVGSYTAAAGARIDVGLSGQVNAAGGIGANGPLGAQGRSLVRLSLNGTRWRVSAEHRFILAAEGETEVTAPALYTLVGDYDDDVDALSGGGFTQHRVGVSGAVEAGAWTVSAGGLARLRAASEEELAAAYGRSVAGQIRLDRRFGAALTGFASLGVSTASSPGRPGYLDAWGWAGVTWRPAAPKEPGSG